jgi:3-oxoacyl-[acyl-carrier protein] reductase
MEAMTAMSTPSGESGRVAVITGGAGAIGSAIASALRRTGHQTVVVDRAGDVICDLASQESTRQAAAAVLARYGRCDVLVHCAAAFDQGALGEVDLATWRHVQAVNVESALWLAQAFTPGMAERGFGRIVLIASDTVWSPPSPVLLPYIASKGALLAIMRTLAVALGPGGIAVSAVAPGARRQPRGSIRCHGCPAGAKAPADPRRHSRRRRLPRIRRGSRHDRTGAVHRRGPGHALNTP